MSTDAINLTDLGGGKWAVDGNCTVSAPGMPVTSFRFERFTLAHSETFGWAAAAGAPQDPPHRRRAGTITTDGRRWSVERLRRAPGR